MEGHCAGGRNTWVCFQYSTDLLWGHRKTHLRVSFWAFMLLSSEWVGSLRVFMVRTLWIQATPALPPSVDWRIRRAGLRTPQVTWALRAASEVRKPSFCTQPSTCVTLARHLNLSVLPFITQQMEQIFPILPNTQGSGKIRLGSRGWGGSP